MHRDVARSESPASGAHPFSMVKAEIFGAQAPRFGFRKRSEKIAQGGEEVDVSAHIGTVGMTDRILIEDEEFIEMAPIP